MQDKRRAVFFDRDGVLNEAVRRDGVNGAVWTAPFTTDEFIEYPEARAAIQAVRASGFLAIVVSNQPDVAYGNMTEEVFQKIMEQTATLGADDIFVCLHRREEWCFCKKPNPGMLLNAAEKWQIDLLESFMIGDTLSDMEAGAAVGCSTALIARSYNVDVRSRADYVLNELSEVISLIPGE